MSLGLVTTQPPCAFCEIVAGRLPASVVYQDALTMAFVDLRQFHPGHTLVIPRKHLPDVRDLSPDTGAALMKTLAQVTRAVSAAFPSEGISLWHSIGPAAFQEVPHLHIHVHPRFSGDHLLEVYPLSPTTADEKTRDSYANLIRQHL